MVSKGFIIPLVLLFAMSLADTCLAQGESGAQFLGIGVGARSVAMGGAYVSLADGVGGLSWNPAGLAMTGGHEFTASHVHWLDDVSYQYAGYATPIGGAGALGVAVKYGSLSFDNVKDDGEGAFEASDLYGAVSYGRRIRPKLGVGASVKYLSSSLGDESAASLAADVGVTYKATDKIAVGAAVTNLGAGPSYKDESDDLPLTLAAGGSYEWWDMTLALDVRKQNDLAMTTHAGVEYTPVEQIALRGGLVLGEDSALSEMMGGLGVSWNDRWKLDYAYRPSDLGATHQFALFAGLGEKADLTDGATPEAVPVAMPRSNLDVMSELVTDAVREVIGLMTIPDGAEVHAKQIDQNPASWLVESILLEELTAEGYQVKSGAMGAIADSSQARSRFEVAYRIISCETSYPRSSRKWLIGSKEVERKAMVDIHFQLSDGSKAIVWAKSVQREYRDIVPGSRLAELGTAGQPFTLPEVKGSSWDKIIEPVIVAGIVGGLIYLFYTSKN